MLPDSAAASAPGRPGRHGRVAALALAAVVLSACGEPRFLSRPPFAQAAAAGACPRPDAASGHQPQFNQQQREIRFLRELGFRGDFFAQLDLGGRYDARREADKNLEDPIEAAVWYALALTNPGGYEPAAPTPVIVDRDRTFIAPAGPGSLYDDCRAFERDQASDALSRLWSRMSSEEQDEVRKRVVYVLSTQGAAGFRILARVSQTDTGPYGEPRSYVAPPHRANEGLYLPGFGPSPPPPASPAYRPYAIELFPRNDVDAYLYDDLAAQGGDVAAYVLLKDFENASPDRSGYADFVEAKANRWVQPFEFYPPDAPASGVPHSDESSYHDEAGEIALGRIGELPFIHVLDALRYLHVINCPPIVFDGRAYSPGYYGLRPTEISAFQAMLGREQTGVLTPLDRVRAIQYAAVDGSVHAQLVLAVMYAEGIGVRADYARAFYWFQEADRGGSPEAKFAIANYFSLGVGGVADQNKAKAVALRLDSAMAGFQPQADHIQAVLAQVTRKLRF